MKKTYPSIGAYNQTIQKKGGAAFRTLTDLTFIPARTMPIKVYLFGSGSYAVVFKAKSGQKTSAIRCFLNSENENIERYKTLANHLKTINTPWQVDCTFLDDEIEVEGQYYPVLKMDWIDGQLINQFISQNINNNAVLTEVQAQLVAISDSLAALNMAHGDLQSGNIMVQGTAANFQLKLIDYDGMFVPDFGGRKSLENGRTEYQHPQRNPNIFSPLIDRFSFWVMITALEAIKYDKSLWLEVMQGGFNSLDNFLFTITDFKNPKQSDLFARLKKVNNKDLNFYTQKLINFSVSDFSATEMPRLANDAAPKTQVFEPVQTMPVQTMPVQTMPVQNAVAQNTTPQTENSPEVANLLAFKSLSFLAATSTEQTTATPVATASSETKAATSSISASDFMLISTPSGANVLTSTFKKLGNTPLTLDKNTYLGKTLLVSLNNNHKKVTITATDKLVEVNL
jgi:hypothetical protein